MSSKSSHTDPVLQTLEQTRLVFWKEHQHWSEQQRQSAWSMRKAQLVSHLLDDASGSHKTPGNSMALGQVGNAQGPIRVDGTPVGPLLGQPGRAPV